MTAAAPARLPAAVAIAGAVAVGMLTALQARINGQQYVGEMTDPAEFSQFVLTSASGAYQKAKSATPTPTVAP